MNVAIDDDVMAVIEFMQSSLPAARLCSIANGVHALAPLLWGHFPSEEVRAIALVSDAISHGDLPRQPSSSEHHLVQ